MKRHPHRRKPSFLFAVEMMLAICCGLPVYAAVHPIQHSAREQINAQILNAASHEIDALARKQQWQDYRYTVNIYIPSGGHAKVVDCARYGNHRRRPAA